MLALVRYLQKGCSRTPGIPLPPKTPLYFRPYSTKVSAEVPRRAVMGYMAEKCGYPTREGCDAREAVRKADSCAVLDRSVWV
jgi:hypothetical protein